MGFDKEFNFDAEQIDNLLPDDIKPTVVVMNPPFSSAALRMGDKTTTANAKRHIQQALNRLEDGGRLVAIVGQGMADNAPAFKEWWKEIKSKYNVRANIGIDGENYRKYGTSFDIQLVVIDKTGPTTGTTLTGKVKDLTELPKLLEGIKNDRTTTSIRQVEQDQVVPGSEKAPGQSRPANLYLHQAAEKALQMFSPKNPKEAALANQDQRLSILRHTLDNLYLLSLKRAYELMTQPLGEEQMLQDLIEEKSKEDKLYVLIQDIETNLFENMSLSEVYRIPEPEL